MQEGDRACPLLNKLLTNQNNIHPGIDNLLKILWEKRLTKKDFKLLRTFVVFTAFKMCGGLKNLQEKGVSWFECKALLLLMWQQS